MHANDYITKRDKIVAAYKRGIVDLENAKLALFDLFAKCQMSDRKNDEIATLLLTRTTP
jgi:hypothetical protein